MEIAILSRNALEAQGLQWVIESHLNGVQVAFTEKERAADCLIVDMELWTPELERWLSASNQTWIGLSSDRTFLTAYRALQGKAEDLLFRPFDPMVFIKLVQQIRFRLRNSPAEAGLNIRHALAYEDFFNRAEPLGGITMAALVAADKEVYPALSEVLRGYPFNEPVEVFNFSDFVLIVYRSEDEEACIEECRKFYAAWNGQSEEPLSIFVNANQDEPVKAYYQTTRQMTSLIFYEGYDIIVLEHGMLRWTELDPFLTPLEQRIWIEMLETRDAQAMRKWMEEEFLHYERPYPDPEMVRIRLTSVLAQARRYMKAVGLKDARWEKRYHEVFEVIVRGPVVYGIVDETAGFIAELAMAEKEEPGKGPGVEKALELIEAHYWDPSWSLAACAETLHMGKSTLSRKFQQKTGKKFSAALTERRLQEAKKLLQETRLSLEEVARLSGFSNASYFSAVYKKFESATPSLFRKQHTHYVR
ncbi:helix-turn-helix transcriptional regulator [Planococcus chinensis]|uniref:Helix-turn-helix transcriptional regulator n=1 Tax=Planococcus chinensis TaxID=272917 RepID=A0ABW4QDI2_9BACL